MRMQDANMSHHATMVLHSLCPSVILWMLPFLCFFCSKSNDGAPNLCALPSCSRLPLAAPHWQHVHGVVLPTAKCRDSVRDTMVLPSLLTSCGGAAWM